VAIEAFGPFGLTANWFWPYGQPEKIKNKKEKALKKHVARYK